MQIYQVGIQVRRRGVRCVCLANQIQHGIVIIEAEGWFRRDSQRFQYILTRQMANDKKPTFGS